MWYWFALSLMFALLIGFGLFTFIRVKKHKDEEPERNELTACIIIDVIILIPFIMLCIDIPSALSGGETLYVTELPMCYSYGHFCNYVVTDNEELRHLKGPNWNRYEKYGDYRISYTRFTKFVLSVDELD